MDDIESYYDAALTLTEIERETLYAEYKGMKKDIEKEFSSKVGLDKRDLTFLFFATALQVIRQYFLTGNLGESFNKEERLAHNDPTIKREVEEKQSAYSKEKDEKKWADNKSKKGYRTWKEIATATSVPYDATKGSKTHNLKLEGKYHRFHTFGHDPILGWIFGTLNILTDTITIRNNNFLTYNVNMKGLIIEDEIFILEVFYNGYESLMEDWHRLPAAVFSQGVHLKSDELTKIGLQPLGTGIFLPEGLAEGLYKNQYDYLCSLRDIKTVNRQAMFSIFINMIIGLIHRLYYTGKTEKERKLYEVKTRKILLYSNMFATTSNVIQIAVTKDMKKLDLGGLLVTVYRIVKDVSFINEVKREFVNAGLNEKYQKKIEKLDRERDEILKELK